MKRGSEAHRLEDSGAAAGVLCARGRGMAEAAATHVTKVTFLKFLREDIAEEEIVRQRLCFVRRIMQRIMRAMKTRNAVVSIGFLQLLQMCLSCM